MRRESLCFFALAMAMATGTAFAGGSINFHEEKYKLGRMATGRWAVNRGWTATGVRKTVHLGDGTTNIPAGGAVGPRSGIFGFLTQRYSTDEEPDPRVWLILKDSSGVTEAESDQPTDTCIIVGIEGGLTGRALKGNLRRAQITINATGHPQNQGDITNSKLNITGATTPETPYPWLTEQNTSKETQIFFHLTGRFDEHTHVTSSLEFGGFVFRAAGVFSHTGDLSVNFE